jgi:ABC-2 type transport system ATP-binding protein
MEEAEKARRIAILDHGRIVALGPPDELRAQIGGEVVTIAVDNPPALAQRLRDRLAIEADVSDGHVRFEQSAGYHSIPTLVDLAGPAIRSISVAKPTLEDVFLKRTGHRFWSQDVGQPFQADRE